MVNDPSGFENEATPSSPKTDFKFIILSHKKYLECEVIP